MKINKKIFLEFLQKIQINKSKLDSSNIINFYENILYQSNNDIMIFNNFFNENLKENFSLNIDSLVLILSKLKDEFIELTIEDLIKIKTEKTEIELTKEDIKYKLNVNVNFNWIDLPKEFINAIKFSRKILEDDYRITKTIMIDNSKVVATNGKVLIIYDLKENFNKFFLNSLQIDLLLKFDIKKYFIHDNLIYFLANDNSIIYFNFETDIKFPSYEKIIMENEKEIKFLDRLDISDINVNIAVLDLENKLLNIEIDKNYLKINSKNNCINIKTILNKENIIDDKIIFGINAEYLLLFLNNNINEFKTYIDNNKILFENENIKFITMLMEI